MAHPSTNRNFPIRRIAVSFPEDDEFVSVDPIVCERFAVRLVTRLEFLDPWSGLRVVRAQERHPLAAVTAVAVSLPHTNQAYAYEAQNNDHKGR